MGASESAPEKPAEAETSPPPRRKVVLKVRMHSLGHGRMEEVPLEVTCPADMRVGIVVSKLADAKQIHRAQKIPEKPVLLSLTRSFCKEYFARLIDGISKLQDASSENW